MEELHKISGELEVPRQKLLRMLLGSPRGFYQRAEVESVIAYLFSLLTDTQIFELTRKVEICDFYIKKRGENKDNSFVTGLTYIKFGFSRQYANRICGVCEDNFTNKK